MIIRNTGQLLKDPKIREPWPDNYVQWNTPRAPKILGELSRLLDHAQDERPLQKFYTKHPYMLALAFPIHCCWVFPKPRLGGGQHIPDFLLCDLNSLGYQWTLIELESPTMEATNKDESVSADCYHAVGQILDYRRWLRDNALTEQRLYRGISAECNGWVVIGRRDGGRTEREKQRLADFRQQHIEIASYDRLLYLAKEHLMHINRSWKEAKGVTQVRRKRMRTTGSEPARPTSA